MKLSELVEENTRLWWEWMKMYPSTKDESLGVSDRASAAVDCEEINSEVSRVTCLMDKVFDD